MDARKAYKARAPGTFSSSSVITLSGGFTRWWLLFWSPVSFAFNLRGDWPFVPSSCSCFIVSFIAMAGDSDVVQRWWECRKSTETNEQANIESKREKRTLIATEKLIDRPLNYQCISLSKWARAQWTQPHFISHSTKHSFVEMFHCFLFSGTKKGRRQGQMLHPFSSLMNLE